MSRALSPATHARLQALRDDLERRQAILDALVAGMQRLIPGFARRRMTLGDFHAACRREGIRVVLRLTHRDGFLSRLNGTPRIVLRANLTREAALFVAFHELGHWVAHPFDSARTLEDGSNAAVEREADNLGYLALRPHRGGPPYPLLVRQDGSHSEGWQELEVRAQGQRQVLRIAPWYAWEPATLMGDGGVFE